ncbi:MAG: hypothetical protein ACLRVT_01890 [Oscillospiraceae bacterium]
MPKRKRHLLREDGYTKGENGRTGIQKRRTMLMPQRMEGERACGRGGLVSSRRELKVPPSGTAELPIFVLLGYPRRN